ncbi:hypothetical protein KSB_66480 [Ktedonobacter robiniae]|uniref:Uncharacterized protein n=1 Tax=Ktedonobacter robiniae TaxID=2778365 RepID=A0ABQ3UZT7_9CHLR|nr:hypothetical protein KSB_66480 [Ktedonobacter robiniae]
MFPESSSREQCIDKYITLALQMRSGFSRCPSFGLLDMTVYGRQEFWEDSPAGWPQRWGENTSEPNSFRISGRPISQWSRLAAGRSNDLGTGTTATAPHGCQNEL